MHDDNERMIRVQSGDKQAYDEIVSHHRLPAITFAYGFVSDISTSEDIVQDCFIKIYVNRSNYKPSYTFKTYLFTLIRNRCIDYLRKNKVRNSVDINCIEELSEEDSTEEIILRKERAEEILGILEGLQDNYRAALYLYAVEELSYKEISLIMKKTVPQVKVIIFRARKKLKKTLEGVDISER